MIESAVRLATLGGLALLAVGVGVWILLRPQRGLLLFVAMAPFHNMIMHATGGAYAWWKELLLVVTLAAAGVRLLLRLAGPVDRRGLRVVPMPWMIPFGILLAIGAASAFLTLPPVVALTPLKITFFYGIMISAIVALAPFDSNDRDHVVSLMMVISFGTAVFGIWQVYVGPDVLATLGWDYNTELRTAGSLFRAISTFPQPFPFAFYEMVALLVCGTVALGDHRRLRNRLYLIGAPIVVCGMALAVVRTALIGFLLCLLLVGLLRFRRLFIGTLAVSAVGAVIAAIFSGSVVRTFGSSSSLGERSSGWTNSLSSIVSHPFGIGLGTTGSAAEKVVMAQGGIDLPYQPDNYYMKMLVELGPLGLWALVGVLVAAALFSYRRFRFTPPGSDSDFALGVFACVVAAAVAGIASTYFEIFPLDAMFWLLLAATATVGWGPSRDVSSQGTPLADERSERCHALA